MRTIQEIKNELRELKNDVRHKQKPALVQVNAPLALIQVEIDAKIAALEWVIRTVKATKP